MPGMGFEIDSRSSDSELPMICVMLLHFVACRKDWCCWIGLVLTIEAPVVVMVCNAFVCMQEKGSYFRM